MKRCLLFICATLIFSHVDADVWAQGKTNSKSHITKVEDSKGNASYTFGSTTTGIVKPKDKPIAYDREQQSTAFESDSSSNRNLNYQNSRNILLPNYGGIR